MTVSAHKFTAHVEGLTNCFIAGGAVTSTFTNRPVVDIDIYPKSWKALEDAIYWAFENSYWCVFASSRAVTFAARDEETPNVQIMTFDEFPTAEHIFDAFDFTCCMGAYDLDSKDFVLHERFLLHCSQRFLSFNPATRFPYASAWRVRKYEEKGFSIGKMEFHKILMACAEKPIRSWDDLREQVGGVYGEAFDIPADQPFSVEAAHRAMATMRPTKNTTGFVSAEEAVVMLSPIEREFFETRNADGTPTFWVNIDGSFQTMAAQPRMGKRVPAFDGGRVFKKVIRQSEGVFCSAHKNSFIYKVGEAVESPDPFIWVTATVEAAREYSIWSTAKDWAVIEIVAAPEDIIWDGNALKIKRGKVVGEHPLQALAVAA